MRKSTSSPGLALRLLCRLTHTPAAILSSTAYSWHLCRRSRKLIRPRYRDIRQPHPPYTVSDMAGSFRKDYACPVRHGSTFSAPDIRERQPCPLNLQFVKHRSDCPSTIPRPHGLLRYRPRSTRTAEYRASARTSVPQMLTALNADCGTSHPSCDLRFPALRNDGHLLPSDSRFIKFLFHASFPS